MKDKINLVKELEESFSQVKKEYKIKVSLEELDKAFFVKDYVTSSGFVSDNVVRQLSARISEGLNSWNSYLHSLILPNPNDFVNVNESKMLSEDEKKKILKLMSRIMYFIRMNNNVNLTNDMKLRAKFLDEVFDFWKNKLSPYLVEITEKLSDEWSKKAS